MASTNETTDQMILRILSNVRNRLTTIENFLGESTTETEQVPQSVQVPVQRVEQVQGVRPASLFSQQMKPSFLQKLSQKVDKAIPKVQETTVSLREDVEATPPPQEQQKTVVPRARVFTPIRDLEA